MKSLFIAILMINTSWAAGSKHCLPSLPGNPSYCTGEKVIVNNGLQGSIGREGKIVAIFDSSKNLEIKFKDGSANVTLSIANIADLKEHRLITGFDYPNQPGIHIVSDTGLNGEVVGKYTNGDAEVRFNLKDEETHRWPMARLAQSEISYCTNGYTFTCMGDYVAGKNETEGKVTGVFENTPYVMVRFFDRNSVKAGRTSHAYKVKADDLVVTQSCHDNPLCNHL